MAKEEPKKEKKSKRKAAAAANGAAAAVAAPGARAAVVASVAAFLEAAGLPRTLAALQSEAGLEVTAVVTLSPVLCVCAVAVLVRCC
jgi:ribosomal protein S11